MLLFILGCLIPAFWVSFLTVAGMRWLAPRVGLIDRPAARKVHKIPTPLGGGVGIWLGVTLPLVATMAALAVWAERPPQWMPSVLSQHVSGALWRAPQLWGILGAGTVLAVVGLIDDKRPISWKVRLVLQVGLSIAIVLSGVRASLFQFSPWVGGALTVLWFVILVNSFNFLDNMDGLSGGIALIVSAVFATMMLMRADDPRWLIGGFFLVLAGALFGFLCHNWSPARIFMGDSGSYFVGFSIASMTVLGTFYLPADGGEHVILAPLCILAIPLYDFTSVILIRLREKRSPFQPDKKHFSHRLVALGLKPVHAVLTVHLATLTTGLAGLMLYAAPNWGMAVLPLMIVVCVLAIIAILESAPRPQAISSAVPTPAVPVPAESSPSPDASR